MAIGGMSRSHYLRTLRERRQFLSNRMDAAKTKNLTPSAYDKAEYNALSWALRELESDRQLEMQMRAARSEDER